MLHFNFISKNTNLFRVEEQSGVVLLIILESFENNLYFCCLTE